MAQATKGQTKAGTAGKKTERVLVHQKGGQPEAIWIGVGWMEFLQKLQGEQLAALSRHWIMWSGVTAKQARIRMQVGIAELRRDHRVAQADIGWFASAAAQAES